MELPGIEPATETALTWVNVEFDYAKLRETTWGYAKGVDAVNMLYCNGLLPSSGWSECHRKRSW